MIGMLYVMQWFYLLIKKLVEKLLKIIMCKLKENIIEIMKR
jgi:hypothetical protein